MQLTELPEWNIGPVRFLNRTSFRQFLAAEARAMRLHDDLGPRATRRHLLFETINYFKHFDWVAEVKIAGCDLKTSEEAAVAAVSAALDCFHLMIGAKWTGNMRVGGAAIDTDRRVRLSHSQEQGLWPTTTTAWAGEVGFQSGWQRLLDDPNIAQVRELSGIALELAVNPDLERPLSRRYLDAAQWFGEACRDTSPATRIVKFVTALERMVMTDEREDLTEILSDRVAALCWHRSGGEGLEDWKRRARAAYDLRSRLVHGSISPSAPEVASAALRYAVLCESTIMSAVLGFGAASLRLNRVAPERLSAWFADVVATSQKGFADEA
jgi:hypothetical protein